MEDPDAPRRGPQVTGPPGDIPGVAQETHLSLPARSWSRALALADLPADPLRGGGLGGGLCLQSRWQIEMALRFQKCELAFESLRLVARETRAKLLGLKGS